MTTVLLVNHSRDFADLVAGWLTGRGHRVLQCPGPGRIRCPVLDGQPCIAADQADVLVYDAWSSGGLLADHDLIFGLRSIHPDRPMILTAPGLEPNWGPMPGEEGIFPLTGLRNADQLEAAISAVLGTSPAPAPGPGVARTA
jgi:hypothetical protein